MKDDKSDDLTPDQKKMLADVVGKRKARERLRRNGAESREAMRRRVQAFAIEKSIPPARIARLLKGRTTMARVELFCEDYDVSADWLLCGDLHGLVRMTKRQKEAVVDDTPYRELLAAFGKLDRAGRKAVVSYLPTQT